MSPDRSETPRLVTPWATVSVAVLALVVPISRGWESALVFDRAAILQGEVWRLWTGNFVQFGARQLWWNLAVLVPAGIWAERIAPGRTRWLLALAPALIGALLLMLEPTLLRYGGLSGLTAGMVAFLAFEQSSRRQSDAWFWWVLLGLLVLKILIELYSGRPLFAALADPGVRPEPLAAVAGVVCARGVYLWRRRI
jgi:rhomboid family GlyGly-CTERM serine protease